MYFFLSSNRNKKIIDFAHRTEWIRGKMIVKVECDAIFSKMKKKKERKKEIEKKEDERRKRGRSEATVSWMSWRGTKDGG